LEAVAVAREILLAECARPDGPRGEIGHCPADDEAEWIIRERLLGAFPEWGYLGEETGASPRADGAEYVWIVDPNDGTRAMQRGYRGHAVSVGLVRRGIPVLGVVCAVNAPDDRGDLVAWAEGCGPMLRNGLPLEPVDWPDRLGNTEVVCASLGANRNPVGYLAAVAPARFVGMPSIAYRLALVAVGECVAVVSLQQLSAWDFAGGHALVRAAGGVVVDEAGREIVYGADGRGGCLRIFGGGKAVVDELVPRSWAGVGGGFGQAAPPPSLAPVRPQPGKLIRDADALSRAQGCILGQVAGDWLGAAAQGIMAGQPSADSELALLLARTLIGRGGFDQDAVAQSYANWSPARTHGTSAHALGRISPLGIWGTWRDAAEVASAARLDAQLTHPHPICQDATAVFAVTIAAAIRQRSDPQQTYAYALAFAQSAGLEPDVRRALESAALGPVPDPPSEPNGVLTALHNAFFELLDAKDPEEAVVRSVSRDSDAAICGALLGAVYGRDALPAHWRRMVLSCRPMPGQPGVKQPRPAQYWPVDALLLAERLLG
jgi:fructose-1,6-bisphosphatase/inositol monophosphatase family enzyme/ADP-ribosylglycohydrolase